MSTKSHVLLNSETEIFEETIEAVHSFGKFMGYNVYAIFSTKIIKLFKMDGHYAYLHLKEDSETANDILPEMKFWMNDILSVELEYDELMIVFKGDGLYSGAWGNKFFKAFSPTYEYNYKDFNR